MVQKIELNLEIYTELNLNLIYTELKNIKH